MVEKTLIIQKGTRIKSSEIERTLSLHIGEVILIQGIRLEDARPPRDDYDYLPYLRFCKLSATCKSRLDESPGIWLFEKHLIQYIPFGQRKTSPSKVARVIGARQAIYEDKEIVRVWNRIFSSRREQDKSRGRTDFWNMYKEILSAYGIRTY